jgi:uncharacterized RDD family membrane protein YckC
MESKMDHTGAAKKPRGFDPHTTARQEALANYPLASFRSRAFAFILDFFLAILIFVPATLLVKWLRGWTPRTHINVDVNFHDIYSLCFLVAYFGLFLYFGKGQTLGKRIFRIRVLSLVHPQLTLWQSIERALGYGASMLEGGFGFLQYFVHPNRCCVHDRIAETIVVKEPA